MIDEYGPWQGIASVRAYNMEAAMLDHFRDLMDANHRAYILFVHTSRWLGVRLDYCAAVCVTVTALLAVLLRHKISPGLLGTHCLPNQCNEMLFRFPWKEEKTKCLEL